MPRMRLYTLLFALLVSLTACNFQSNVQLNIDENSTTATVTMQESEVQTLFTTLLSNQSNPLLETPGVDLRPGEVFVRGIIVTERGDRVPGSMSVYISASNGGLSVRIDNVDFGNLTVQSAEIDRINASIAEGLQRSAANNNSGAQITNVTITDTTLSFTITAPRRR
ncbi:MAG: hypothetical protein H6670_14185 [Anaerolineaceae bacterium]|nr:hypothetical protein [Anaerolineae bacterium]MCB9460796.1 hypothetical protein [Anaerolineaceae bacterium]